jgi:hypothetical protein
MRTAHSFRTGIASATLAIALIASAGCSKKPQDNPMPGKEFVNAGVQMKLDPAAAPNCNPNTLFRATLSWSVDGQAAPKTEVRIDKPDGNVFARSNDRSTHADTGNWVKPGTWFLLFDRKSGNMLGALRAGPTPCP